MELLLIYSAINIVYNEWRDAPPPSPWRQG